MKHIIKKLLITLILIFSIIVICCKTSQAAEESIDTIDEFYSKFCQIYTVDKDYNVIYESEEKQKKLLQTWKVYVENAEKDKNDEYYYHVYAENDGKKIPQFKCHKTLKEQIW